MPQILHIDDDADLLDLDAAEQIEKSLLERNKRYLIKCIEKDDGLDFVGSTDIYDELNRRFKEYLISLLAGDDVSVSVYVDKNDKAIIRYNIIDDPFPGQLHVLFDLEEIIRDTQNDIRKLDNNEIKKLSEIFKRISDNLLESVGG